MECRKGCCTPQLARSNQLAVTNDRPGGLADMPDGKQLGGLTTMEIRVLKVRREENLDELKGVITTGHTVIGQRQGGWQVPAPSQIGDLAVWYKIGRASCRERV